MPNKPSYLSSHLPYLSTRQSSEIHPTQTQPFTIPTKLGGMTKKKRNQNISKAVVFFLPLISSINITNPFSSPETHGDFKTLEEFKVILIYPKETIRTAHKMCVQKGSLQYYSIIVAKIYRRVYPY